MPFDANELDDFKERIKQYITKVVREAKVHSSWIQPNEPYEQGFYHFIDCILEPSDANAFWRDFLPFQKQIAAYGIFNSLSQVLLKMTSPGIPDFYQGSELWDLNLVDPDNRRPVDFGKRKRFLEKIRVGGNDVHMGIKDELIRTRQDGQIKLFLIFKILNVRRENAGLFEKGSYQPLEIRGKYSNHAIGFLRRLEDQLAITIAPRFLTTLMSAHELPLGTDVWKDTEVFWPESVNGPWQNAITDDLVVVEKTTPVGWLLARFPVCLLIK